MFTRRALLAAGVAVTAGCTGLQSGTTTTTPTGNGPETTTPSGSDETPTYVRWRQTLSHDELGLLSLGGGPETPAIYVGSAATDTDEPDDSHALHALSLQDGHEQWRVTVPDPVQTAPMFAGSRDTPRVVFATGRESLHGRAFEIRAIEHDSGEAIWQFDIDDRRFLYPIETTDESVFVGRRDDQLGERGEAVYALDAVDGSERWRAATGDVSRQGNARRRDTLLVKTMGRVTALDIAAGKQRWDAAAETAGYDNRGKRVFVEDSGTVRGLALADGREHWSREFDGVLTRVTTPRAAMDETVFVAEYDGRLHALGSLDGETRWTLSVDREQFRPSVERTSERLYVDGAGVHALAPVSGEQHWSFTPAADRAVLVAASRTVFARTTRRLWALDSATGKPRWEFAPGSEFVGVATAGHFAFVAVDGAVYALDGRTASGDD